MFDKKKFAQILKNISDEYDNQRDFSKKSGINRTYLSQYINLKLEEPPKPKLLEKLANSSYGITNYSELMKICGYTEKSLLEEYLDDFYQKKEENLIENLTNISLSTEENETYQTLIEILLNLKLWELTEDEIDAKIASCFESINWLMKNQSLK